LDSHFCDEMHSVGMR